jgi:hypothetical protein
MDNANQLSLDFESKEPDKSLEKVEKIAKEKRELLDSIHSGNVNNTREKVAYILNNSNEARNSDVELAWLYWKTFENKIFNGYNVTKEDLKNLTGIGSLTRARAKIQNEYKLFQADDTVKKYRGKLEKEKKLEILKDKPTNLPLYSVYIDEAGKTQKYLIIGSLWIIDGGFSTFNTSVTLSDWVEKNGIKYEFHFSQLTKHKLQSYKDFFLKFLSLNPTIGFKAIMIQNLGFQELSKPITDLTYHLIYKGLLHEHTTGRAPLPRLLQVWLDDEQAGSDKLKLENLKERISAQNLDGLYLGDFEVLVSKNNYFIQAVDLFTSSINRKLNSQDSEGHIKDDLAEFILSILNFNVSDFSNIANEIDKTKVFNLTHNEKE